MKLLKPFKKQWLKKPCQKLILKRWFRAQEMLRNYFKWPFPLWFLGGRHSRDDLSLGRKHPIFIHDNIKRDALIRFIHAKTSHQGLKTTLSAIWETGFWPIGNRRWIDWLFSTLLQVEHYAPQSSPKKSRPTRTTPQQNPSLLPFGYWSFRPRTQ